MNLDQYMWIEKYRPRTVDECILSKENKEYFKSLLVSEEIPNLLLNGNAGCGKTTIAKALCEELKTDWMFINGSEDSGIDTLRCKIRDFAVTKSLSGNTKVVIIDEADYLNPNSFQPAFRAFLEEFASNCRFILTCNNKNRIIKPLHSRLTTIEFKLEPDDKPLIAKQFFKRITHILKSENIEVNNEVTSALINKYFPDFRRIIVELQRNASNGVISTKILSESNEANVEEVMTFLKSKDWKLMREWVAQNVSEFDINDLFRFIYDNFINHTEQGPQLVYSIGEWQYKSAFVSDHEIIFAAFLTEVMTNCEFK